jgi:hypothetical protein
VPVAWLQAFTVPGLISSGVPRGTTDPDLADVSARVVAVQERPAFDDEDVPRIRCAGRRHYRALPKSGYMVAT